MYDVDWTTIAWIAAAVIVLVLLIWRADATVRELLVQRRFKLQADEKDAAVTRQELQHQANLNSHTLADQITLRSAELAHRAAEAYAQASLTEATVADRVSEQRHVIAARAEGRATAAREEAAKYGDDSDTNEFATLLRAYRAYLETHGPDSTSLSDWLGSIRFIGDLPIRP